MGFMSLVLLLLLFPIFGVANTFCLNTQKGFGCKQRKRIVFRTPSFPPFAGGDEGALERDTLEKIASGAQSLEAPFLRMKWDLACSFWPRFWPRFGEVLGSQKKIAKFFTFKILCGVFWAESGAIVRNFLRRAQSHQSHPCLNREILKQLYVETFGSKVGPQCRTFCAVLKATRANPV